jgi:hypothetical protein
MSLNLTDEFNSTSNSASVELDDDIQAEEDSVAQSKSKTDFALCIDKLVKIFPPPFLGGKAKYAVRGLSLGCPTGERFGFLGDLFFMFYSS